MTATFRLLPLAALLFAFVSPAALAQETVGPGKLISFNYTLSSDGQVLESTDGGAPLTYMHGGGQILPKLEGQLEGMKVGDKKSVSLVAADAYGEIQQDAIQEVPSDQIPEDARIEGAVLRAEGFPGPIMVREVKEETVVLDFNHPLAGQDLTFDIEITGIDDAPPMPAQAPVPPPLN